MRRAADALAALLYPQGCHVCGSAVRHLADGVACGACWEDPSVTPLFQGRARCERCGLPGMGRCVSCAPEELAGARAVGAYAGALKASLLDLKRRPRVAGRLARLLAETYRLEPVLRAAAIVAPVPLHPDRLADRGHNQAEVLARALARTVGLEVLPQALWRPRAAAKRRGGFDRASREQSVRSAFSGAGRVVAGRRVLLVDDLFTTGATLGACARALLEAGATDVAALTAARVLVGPAAARLGVAARDDRTVT